MPHVDSYSYFPTSTPQEHKDDEARLADKAKMRQALRSEAKKGALEGKENDDDDNTTQKPKKLKPWQSPASIEDAKQYFPAGVSASMWHEWQSDRIRASYKYNDVKSTVSEPIGDAPVSDAVIGTLRKLWKLHTDCGHAPSPYKQLRE